MIIVVGMVIVSHSKKLAHEIIELCNEMKKYDFPVINGSGTTGDHLGSDPMIIKEAIENAYSEDGVLIFGDIGSSILNSEMAMEFLDAEYDRAKIKIADAPIVEGTLIAMAINDGKTSLEEILEELKDLKNFNKV
ncbi:PTS-dependent dihydroxyacetone kinase phosphotransferase subunit DhaM [Fusobacterium ulcerans]|uniref:phosphoenolpyruvate--glycerone phosphotransferase n=2 Tax=Fusobacterium ulcerans TaxID=861 RepID=A0AAX2JAG5_9FUSO|nr:PTS-dependent dihydroxyacetone kinase phosphotransferase subunit DhaM [Fusobacterium ulcerans]EFS27612.1 dihydroxyacetone kinase, phosphotransfer subunit [Fusobacterium ulcerans ATCC 49185]EHO76764.2 dihydroxyacetone kinase, phosphotransfer subunit [Fusobacterium ulcerans 12-1B]SQJ02990.1 PTS-dependent dihydroxyacetone kinase, phosphotransferase subunit dhaM [Fusobacterium ulcerans]